MIENLKKFGSEHQESIVKGIDSVFAFQRQVFESTLEIYEKGLNLRSEGYAGARKQVEKFGAILETQLATGQEKVKENLVKLAGKYLPDSVDKIEKVEKVVAENVDRVASQLKGLLNNSVDPNVQKVLGFEKDLIQKVRSLFDENLGSYQTQVKALLGVEEVKKAPVKKAAKKAAPKAAETAARKAPSKTAPAKKASK